MSTNDFMGSIRNNWRQRATEKTTFKGELRIVPRWLLRLVIVLYVAALVIAEFMNVAGSKGVVPGGMFAPDLGLPLSVLALAGLVTVLAVAGAAFIFLMGYIYADAMRRGMSPGLWLLIAIVIPYFVGVFVYFIVREPLPFNCPQCQARVSAQFNFCPRCQLNLRPSCPRCRREIESGDRFCAYCGAGIDPAAAVRARPSCPQCHREIDSPGRYCPFCGASLNLDATGQPTPGSIVPAI